MKRIVCMLLAGGMLLALTGCDSLTDNGITTENAVIMDVVDAAIRYRPVCPACGHENESRHCALYPGEGDSIQRTATCEECWYTFELSIERE